MVGKIPPRGGGFLFLAHGLLVRRILVYLLTPLGTGKKVPTKELIIEHFKTHFNPLYTILEVQNGPSTST